jgi:drug/metabolite transporter (DMT)-like permease
MEYLTQIIAYFLFFVLILTYALFTYWNKKAFAKGIKGENKKYDTPEIVVIYWLIGFPFLLAGDFFLNFEGSSYLWGSMDIILLSALGVSAYNSNKAKGAVPKMDNPPPPPKGRTTYPDKDES